MRVGRARPLPYATHPKLGESSRDLVAIIAMFCPQCRSIVAGVIELLHERIFEASNCCCFGEHGKPAISTGLVAWILAIMYTVSCYWSIDPKLSPPDTERSGAFSHEGPQITPGGAGALPLLCGSSRAE
jgi:hypothetical protein